MALTLHALWSGYRLYLFSEMSGDPAARAGLENIQALRAALGEASPDSLLVAAAEASALDLWLPCDEQGPITSTAAHASHSGEAGMTALLVGELRKVRV